MAGDGETRLSPAALHRHATSVETAASGMETGRGAAAQVQMGAAAYGQICSFLPGLIDTIADRVISAMGESASALHETAANVRTVASSAEQTDAAAARRVGSAGGSIELPL